MTAPTEQELKELYSSLSDERIATIALKEELTPDAKRALILELEARGISDLAPWKREIDQDLSRLDAQRGEKLKRFSQMRAAFGVILYGLSILCVCYSTFLLIVAPQEGSRIVGVILIAVAAIFAASAWIYLRLLRLWHERVLFKPWWR